MTSSPSTSTAELWQIDPATAKLCAERLRGEVRLDNPATGIGQLAWNNAPLDGSILGVSAGESGAPQEAFARGTDLVAVYETTGPQSFSWQVYWRAIERDGDSDGDVIVLDAILSFQTALLESFPGARTQSQLSADEAWLVGSDGKSKKVDPQQFGSGPTDDCNCVVLRTSTGNWSYAEMTHPLDQGTFQLARSENGQTLLQRELGGSFLEKGVIRRLRLRGAFLPRENDLGRAAGLFTELATESPPLTV
jgi:hypothetical protein